ncbi:hypothetical protein D9M72_313610 [compost metagenome]
MAYDDEEIAKNPELEAITSTAVGKKKLSQSDREAIVSLYKELRAKGRKGYTALTAKEIWR